MTLAVENITTAVMTGGTALNVNVTTSGTDRIICLVVHAGRNSAAASISSVTASGLTFYRETGQQWTAGTTSYHNDFELWWAYAAATQTAKTVTITFDLTIDDSSVTAFAVSGSTAFTAPFDTSSGMPYLHYKQAAETNIIHCYGVSTDWTNTILFEFNATLDGSGYSIAPTGWTEMGHVVNTGGTKWSTQEGAYKAYSSAQASISFDCNGTSSGVWGLMVFAVRDSEPGGGSAAASSDAALSSDMLLAQEHSSDAALSSDMLLAQEHSSDKALADAASSSDTAAASDKALADAASSDALLAQEHSSDKALADAASSSNAALSSDYRLAHSDSLAAASDKAIQDASSSNAALSSDNYSAEIAPPPPIQTVVVGLD